MNNCSKARRKIIHEALERRELSGSMQLAGSIRKACYRFAITVTDHLHKIKEHLKGQQFARLLTNNLPGALFRSSKSACNCDVVLGKATVY